MRSYNSADYADDQKSTHVFNSEKQKERVNSLKMDLLQVQQEI